METPSNGALPVERLDRVCRCAGCSGCKGKLLESGHIGEPLLTVSQVKEREGLGPTPLTYGWQRAPVVGAFFNGAFLLALGVSIFFQSLERFMGTNKVEEIELILVLGCV